MAKVGSGFPHSEIQGSKPVRGSPRLIAAYHVLHRLSAPRHPPDTLMTLDRSHYRCPLGESENSPGEPESSPHWHRREVQLTELNPKTFASKHVRDGMRSSFPSPSPALRDPSCDGQATGLHRPFGPGRFGLLTQASRPTPKAGHIHSSQCRTTRSASKASDAPTGSPVANSLGADESLARRKAWLEGWAVSIGPSLDPARRRGGARRDRTDDLMLAKHALSQLSYCPNSVQGVRHPAPRPAGLAVPTHRRKADRRRLVGLGRLELPTSRLSSARSNQLSYKPERARDNPGGSSADARPTHVDPNVMKEERETKTAASRQMGP